MWRRPARYLRRQSVHAWSGKDFFKADRAGALHARRLAKLVVQLGLATEARVILHWFPGDREARVLDIETPPGQPLAAHQIASFVDLTQYCLLNVKIPGCHPGLDPGSKDAGSGPA